MIKIQKSNIAYISCMKEYCINFYKFKDGKFYDNHSSTPLFSQESLFEKEGKVYHKPGLLVRFNHDSSVERSYDTYEEVLKIAEEITKHEWYDLE